MFDFRTLASCADLTLQHAEQAASSVAELRALLTRVSEIAQPGEGCPKVLMAVARLVDQEWLEGDLRVELSGDEASTTLVILCEHGAGLRERLVPTAHFAVGIDEFERALALAPKLVLPLTIQNEGGTIVLASWLTQGKEPEPLALPELELESLAEGQRPTAPPPRDELLVVDEAMPGEPEVSGSAPPDSGEHELVAAERMSSGLVPAGQAALEREGKSINVHTRPTVRRMVAVDAAAIAALSRRDPRREED